MGCLLEARVPLFSCPPPPHFPLASEHKCFLRVFPASGLFPGSGHLAHILDLSILPFSHTRAGHVHFMPASSRRPGEFSSLHQAICVGSMSRLWCCSLAGPWWAVPLGVIISIFPSSCPLPFGVNPRVLKRQWPPRFIAVHRWGLEHLFIPFPARSPCRESSSSSTHCASVAAFAPGLANTFQL